MEIDLVYTWVNDKDPVWAAKKAQFDESAKNCNKDAVSKCRFFNNDELKYSLRSFEKNIPWINKIFIITDNQTPDWLNLENPKIKIIDHTQIIPNEKLPTYNACTIENAMVNIEELSEYFIYANDDMFFWDKIEPDFFFKNNKPICRVDRKINKNKKYKHLYGSMIFRAYSLIKERFGADFPYFPHHNADGYKKSTFKECIGEFKEEFETTINNRFRDFSDIQRMIVYFYALYKNEATLKNINLNLFDKIKGIVPDSEYYDARPKTLKNIIKSKAKLMCINDSRKTTDESRKKIKEFLETKFPEKSNFEK